MKLGNPEAAPTLNYHYGLHLLPVFYWTCTVYCSEWTAHLIPAWHLWLA